MNQIFLWIVIAIVITESCYSKTTTTLKNNGIKSYQIVHSVFPAMEPGNIDLNKSDTEQVKIFFWQDQILYKASHYNYYIKDGKHVDKKEKQDFIVVCFRDSTHGYFYDLFRNRPAKRVNTDSLLSERWFGSMKLYSVFLESDYKLISEKDIQGGKEEVYELKGRGTDSNKTGFITLFYTRKINDPCISLSRELDTLPSMKLAFVKTITNARTIQSFALPKIELSYWLEELHSGEEIKKTAQYFINYKMRE